MQSAHTLYLTEIGELSDRHIADYRERTTGGYFADKLTEGL